jgi:putative transcriptional regulator
VNTKRTLPLSDEELAAFEATRDLAAELLLAAREMKAGLGQVVYSPIIAARRNTGLSQEDFAALLGVSVLTLENWEQGREQPTGAAKTLLAIARHNPQALLDAIGK